MTFAQEYNNIKSSVQDELKIIEAKLIEQINVREPLNTAVKKFLTSPSKRIRPLLTILYLKAKNQTLNDNQLSMLSVIELIHNASLIHDDIIDECKIRRGQKTINSEFDNKLGVISGDYFLAVAMGKLTEIGNIEIISRISKTVKNMCMGEVNQYFDKFKVGTIEDYIEKTKNKTAYLFETSLICTAMLGDFSYDKNDLSEFGLNFGIAFQIRDDILNFLNTDNLKPVNNDLKEGIYNAPVILGQESDNYSTGIEKTKDLLNNYIEKANRQLKKLPDSRYKTLLKELLELINNV